MEVRFVTIAWAVEKVAFASSGAPTTRNRMLPRFSCRRPLPVLGRAWYSRMSVRCGCTRGRPVRGFERGHDCRGSPVARVEIEAKAWSCLRARWDRPRSRIAAHCPIRTVSSVAVSGSTREQRSRASSTSDSIRSTAFRRVSNAPNFWTFARTVGGAPGLPLLSRIRLEPPRPCRGLERRIWRSLPVYEHGRADRHGARRVRRSVSWSVRTALRVFAIA